MREPCTLGESGFLRAPSWILRCFIAYFPWLPHCCLDEDMRRDLISKVMREMGRKGGKTAGGKGGKTRMAALTPQERKELASKAAPARWAKAKKKRKPSAKR